MSNHKNKTEVLEHVRLAPRRLTVTKKDEYRFGTNPGDGLNMPYYLSKHAVGYLTGHYGIKPADLSKADIDELAQRGVLTIVDAVVEEAETQYCVKLVGLKRRNGKNLDETLMLYTLENEEGIVEEEEVRGYTKIGGFPETDFSDLEEGSRVPVISRGPPVLGRTGGRSTVYTDPQNALFGSYRDNLDGLEALLSNSHDGEHLVSQFENAAY